VLLILGRWADELLNDLLRRFPSADDRWRAGLYEQQVATVVGFVERRSWVWICRWMRRHAVFNSESTLRIPVGSTVNYSGLAQ
jgi:hypothetical protein